MFKTLLAMGTLYRCEHVITAMFKTLLAMGTLYRCEHVITAMFKTLAMGTLDVNICPGGEKSEQQQVHPESSVCSNSCTATFTEKGCPLAMRCIHAITQITSLI